MIQPIEWKWLHYLNATHITVSFFIFPMLLLTYFHGWLIGIVGYLAFVMGLGFIANNIPRAINLIFFQPLLVLPVFYAFQLAMGGWLAAVFWVVLCLFYLTINYYQYQTTQHYIQKHREGVEIAVQFPTALPPKKGKEQERKYFDPLAFEWDYKDTLVLALPLTYEVNGKKYQQTYDYHLEASKIEPCSLFSYYKNHLSGSPLTLKYVRNNPQELLAVIPPNDLSTFEAFTIENHQRDQLDNCWHLFLILVFAAAFYFYYQ